MLRCMSKVFSSVTVWSSEDGREIHVGSVICCVIVSCYYLRNGIRLCFSLVNCFVASSMRYFAGQVGQV